MILAGIALEIEKIALRGKLLWMEHGIYRVMEKTGRTLIHAFMNHLKLKVEDMIQKWTLLWPGISDAENVGLGVLEFKIQLIQMNFALNTGTLGL